MGLVHSSHFYLQTNLHLINHHLLFLFIPACDSVDRGACVVKEEVCKAKGVGMYGKKCDMHGQRGHA